MAYNAYEQFIAAARKFPRWSNIRRRPVESNGGKILRSIIEEIAAVEDAIIAYKKDFFIVNYIGREEEIIDYLYAAHVGNITDLSSFSCMDPEYKVTDDKETFYNDKSYAYYENGYLVMYQTNDDNRLQYVYNDNIYYAVLEEEHIWNVIDEFAWWCGLERFEGERNASLLKRSLYQLYRSPDNPETDRRPNSTEKGLKNALRNAASFIGNLSEDEIHFLEPNEKTLALKNEDGITLYEEISRFNRDIARTRQWDIDYWDNAFRQLYYLPHKWDEEVSIYKNGVGYMNSLLVSTAKDMHVESTTDISINGYIPSAANIEQYVESNHITQTIPLKLMKYGDTNVALPVQYKIVAQDTLYIDDPSKIYFDFYQSRTGRHVYYAEDFVASYEDGIVTVDNRFLKPNQEYVLTFSSKDGNTSRMEVSTCDIVDGNKTISKLKEDPEQAFGFEGNRLVDLNVLLHATNMYHIANPDNLQNADSGGLTLKEPLKKASFEIPLYSFLKGKKTVPLVMPVSGGMQQVTFLPQFVKQENCEKTDDGYQLANSLVASQITIQSNYCRALYFDLVSDYSDSKAEISVTVNGVETTYSRTAQQNFFSLDFRQASKVTIVIRREKNNEHGFIVKNIKVAEYDIHLSVKHYDSDKNFVSEEKIPFDKRMLLNGTDYESYLYCTIDNYTGISPLIEYIHVGSQTKNRIFTLAFNTNNTTAPQLVVDTNCNIKLEKIVSGSRVAVNTYNAHLSYKNNADISRAIYFDLSSFSSLAGITPAMKQGVSGGKNLYYIVLRPQETITNLTIDGNGFSLITTKTLKDILKVASNEKVYLAQGEQGFIIKSATDVRLQQIKYKDVHIGDRIRIRSTKYPTIQPSFLINEYNGAPILSYEYSGVFNSLYLYPYNGKDYIAYNPHHILRAEEQFQMVDTFHPVRPKNALLLYTIAEIIPNNGIKAAFLHNGKERSWTIDPAENILVKAEAYKDIRQNPNIVSAETLEIHPLFRLSNTLSLKGLSDDTGNQLDLAEYIIIPPDNMTVDFARSTQSHHQIVSFDEGGEMYVQEDGFNKLQHSNITSITKVVLDDGRIVSSSKYALMKEEGLIVWLDESLYGNKIEEIEYNYKEPISLRYKNIEDLYDITGYKIDTLKCVNKKDYTVKDAEADSTIAVDYSYFTEKPTILVASCEKPFFATDIQNGEIIVSKIADDTSPVIHNGYYYVDGKEYYYFSNYKKQDEKRLDGIDIKNGEIINNVLLLKQEAVNYLRNSKMECNKMDVHCIVDFMYPKNKTNQEPLGHIGACESFSSWHDYAVVRSLTTYKNGFAVQFTAKENGYSLLDITRFIAGHKTISCLYNGNLVFSLAREIRILNEQSFKTTFCEKIKEFTPYSDIAYCSLEDTKPETYRYYLVVEGDGVLDEVLVHDAVQEKDMMQWHKKGIDLLGLHIEETAKKEKEFEMEYSPDFMSYYNLETGADGILRPGTTVDWNISVLHIFDLSAVSMQNCLFRNGTIVAQSNQALIETKPIEIRYRRSIQKVALTINNLIQKKFKGFAIKVLASNTINGTYMPIASAQNNNTVSFSIKESNRYLKFQIEAKEGQLICDMRMLATHKEDEQEDLSVFYNTEGSAVTKVFDTGVKGIYQFVETIAEEGSTWKDIYIRGAKESANKELIWTSWKNTKSLPEFDGYQLFQFKIIMDQGTQHAKIKSFRFEVLANV